LLLSIRPTHLSVCPSVACIANNSRTQRPSVPKFKFPTLDATSCSKGQTWYTDGGRRPASATGQRSKSQAHIVCTSHLCLFLIRETKCCTCVTRGEGHTVSAELGGHTYCYLGYGKLPICRAHCRSTSNVFNAVVHCLSKK